MDKAELISSIVIIITGIILRLISHYEHKDTSKKVAEIYILMNGELQKKLEQARQDGRDEVKLK